MRNMYKTSAYFSRLTEEEQGVLRTAGKENCLILQPNGDFIPPSEIHDFQNHSRYRLAPEYKVPTIREIKVYPGTHNGVGDYLYVNVLPAPRQGTIRLANVRHYKNFRGYKWANGDVTWDLSREGFPEYVLWQD